MHISITRLEVKGILWLPLFMIHASRSVREGQASKGLIHMETWKGKGLVFHTLTVWEDERKKLAFVRGKAHLIAMKMTSKMARSARSLHYEGEAIPTRGSAERQLEFGKIHDLHQYG